MHDRVALLVSWYRRPCFPTPPSSVHRLYYSSKFNVFDCVVVGLSIVEIVVEQWVGSGASSGLSALRSFRLLRVFRLAKTWKDFQVRATAPAHPPTPFTRILMCVSRRIAPPPLR